MKCNLVMVRDYYRFFYHAGINRDVATFDAVLQVFRQCQEGMPDVRRSATLGSSAGGYAALLFGHHLGVDAVFAFAPQTLIDADKLREMSGRDELWRIPEEHRDLSLLLARHNGRTRYEVYYCQDNDEDRRFADRLRDCPGIHLHPQPGDTHFVLSQMHRDGQLPSFLAGSVNPGAAGSRSD
jgi:hypothetical protein